MRTTGKAMTSETSAAARPPISSATGKGSVRSAIQAGSPLQWECRTLGLTVKKADTYAPMHMNAAWPMENMPEKPFTRLRLAHSRA